MQDRSCCAKLRDLIGAGVGIATYWGAGGREETRLEKNRDGYLTAAGSALKMCFIDWLGPL